MTFLKKIPTSMETVHLQVLTQTNSSVECLCSNYSESSLTISDHSEINNTDTEYCDEYLDQNKFSNKTRVSSCACCPCKTRIIKTNDEKGNNFHKEEDNDKNEKKKDIKGKKMGTKCPYKQSNMEAARYSNTAINQYKETDYRNYKEQTKKPCTRSTCSYYKNGHCVKKTCPYLRKQIENFEEDDEYRDQKHDEETNENINKQGDEKCGCGPCGYKNNKKELNQESNQTAETKDNSSNKNENAVINDRQSNKSNFNEKKSIIFPKQPPTANVDNFTIESFINPEDNISNAGTIQTTVYVEDDEKKTLDKIEEDDINNHNSPDASQLTNQTKIEETVYSLATSGFSMDNEFLPDEDFVTNDEQTIMMKHPHNTKKKWFDSSWIKCWKIDKR